MTNTPMSQSATGERIAKAIARAGVCSRREAERLIEEGRVKLNGQVLDTPAVKVTPDMVIEVDGRKIAQAEHTRLFRHHKPVGVICTDRDPEGRKTVFDGLPKDLPRLLTIGRLDLNSEGLILLTNDGALARTLELPSTGWTRRYRARAYGRVDQIALKKLENGVTVDGERFGAIKAVIERQQGGNMWINVSLKEGKNREVRRALESLGLKVNRLIRTAYGPFNLGKLAKGGVEEVTSKQMRELLGGLMPRT